MKKLDQEELKVLIDDAASRGRVELTSYYQSLLEELKNQEERIVS